MRISLLALVLSASVSLLTPGCGDESAVAGPGDEPGPGEDDESPDAPSANLDAGRGRLDASLDATVRNDPDKPAADAGVRGDASTAAPKPDAGKPVDPARPKPKCVKKPSQVMIIGDSYINWITHTFGADMAKEAGQTWRMEAIGAYSLGSGGIGFIGDQYKMSIARDPDCHTILMDGGGNDVLVADPAIDPNSQCKTDMSPMLPQCQTIIDKAIAAADKILVDASAAGIRDVVFFFYPHVPVGTLLGGPNPNAMIDFALPQIREFCAGVEPKTAGKTRCTMIDMVPVFKGHDDWFVFGDIHENSLGSAAMAKKVWEVMKQGCIAQPASSGCCEE